MRILHVVPAFYPSIYHGGSVVYELCNSLLPYGAEIRVLTTDALEVERRALSRGTLEYPVYFSKKVWGETVAPGLPSRLLNLVRWANVVHLTEVYSFPTLPCMMACKIMDKPILWSPLGALQRWEGSTRLRLKSIWESICKYTLPKQLVLHVTSEQEREESLKAFPALEAVVMPHGVEIPSQITHEESQVLRLLYLGRLDAKKGIENLFLTCKLLKDRLKIPWKLILGGGGNPGYFKNLAFQKEALGLGTQVEMIGEVVGKEKKRQLFENTDMVVVPSYTENFCIVVAESLAHGVPVIVSQGTPWRRVEEKGCGLWVKNQPESLAQAIEQMREMPLRAMGDRGRQWMREEFSWGYVARRMNELYHHLFKHASEGVQLSNAFPTSPSAILRVSDDFQEKPKSETLEVDLIVLTLNEEVNLARCLESVKGLVKNIFVVDSGSTDRTVEIAIEYGAQVVTHAFTTQAEQFNWALDHLPIKSEWILRLDADEHLLPELKEEIFKTLPNLSKDICGLYIKRRMIFLGRWIRHGGYYPTWILRLFKHGKARSEDAELNEHIVLLEGRGDHLKNDFVDEDYKDLSAWSRKHLGYAIRQNRFLLKTHQTYDPSWNKMRLFGNQVERKRWFIGHLYGKAPIFLRAFFYFLYRYFFRLGILDGFQGLIFHFLHGCWYMFYTDALLFEAKLRQKDIA
ncbi:MAG: glycosyltransferase [Chlamydiae bacterium]|nr:glycosyltransferase [Chlamydiota bacterium]MBI3276197.1 glycosyltransferase [Chlamydiota bacterium]